MAALGVGLPAETRRGFGRQPVAGSHRPQDLELFSDAALIDLLDHFPRRHLYALNMGTLALAKTSVQCIARRLRRNPLEFRHQPPVLRVVAGAPGSVVELNPVATLAVGRRP